MYESTHDSALRRRVQSVFARAKLPTNPAIAAEILKLVNDPNSTAAQFAGVIRNDAALTARLMTMGNSAQFATRQPVTTIRRAVTVLGLRRIRMAAVSFQLVAHLDRLGGADFNLPRFWQESALRACLAREIARKVVPELAEEAFLVGLLQDCGLLLLVQLLGQPYAEFLREVGRTPGESHAEERRRFPHHHVEVIGIMAEEWRLPEPIARPLAFQHRIARVGAHAAPVDRLCAASYFVGSLRITADEHAARAEPLLLDYARTELGLDEADIEAALAAVQHSYQEVAGLFGDALPADIDVTDLLIEANRQLSIAATATDRHAQELEAQRDRFAEERHTLRHAVAQYREKAARDPLTGALNRGALLDSATSLLNDCADEGRPVTVFFLDIDNFKRLNDVHGHTVGDDVLRRVALVASESACNAGIVGRYGGEEFVIVTAGLRRDEAEQYADRLVRAVRHLDVGELGLRAPVTISLGAIWGHPRGTPQELFTVADQLMYEAKRAGKDRAVFRMYDGPAASAATSPVGRRGPACGDATDLQPAERLFLAAERLNGRENDEFLNARKQPRRDMLAACRFSYLVGPSLSVRTEEACVRNISAGGVGVVFTRAMVRGDLVEIRLEQPGGHLYVAGLVAFCRHIEPGVYEIGIQLINNAAEPIISADPHAAIARLNWVARAVQNKYGDGLAQRKSA